MQLTACWDVMLPGYKALCPTTTEALLFSSPFPQGHSSPSITAARQALLLASHHQQINKFCSKHPHSLPHAVPHPGKTSPGKFSPNLSFKPFFSTIPAISPQNPTATELRPTQLSQDTWGQPAGFYSPSSRELAGAEPGRNPSLWLIKAAVLYLIV